MKQINHRQVFGIRSLFYLLTDFFFWCIILIQLVYLIGTSFTGHPPTVWVTTTLAGFLSAGYWYLGLSPDKLATVAVAGFVLYWIILLSKTFLVGLTALQEPIDAAPGVFIWAVSYFLPAYVVYVRDRMPEILK
ncbi:MAG: hypothetical protein ABEK59_00975 [Halobacteria archaeon]